jgi:hypothetical protein
MLCAAVALLCWLPAAPAFAQPFALAVRSDGDDIVYRINLATGAVAPIGPIGFADVESIAIHPHTGVIYAVDDITDQLIIVNPITGAGTAVAPTGVGTITDHGLAFDGAGNLYMSVDAPQNAYKLNPRGGGFLMGAQGQQVTGLAWLDGVLFGLGGDNTNNLVALNQVTGQSQVIGALGGTLSVSDGGIGFDRNDVLWGIEDGGTIFQVNPQTGAGTTVTTTLIGFEDLIVIRPTPVITAPGAGLGPQVVGRVDTNGDGAAETLTANFFAYDPGFSGGVRVARCDLDGDGRPDLITAPGPGGASFVRAFSGLTGAAIMGFVAYDGFFGGVYIACGDTNGDGKADIVTAPGPGGGPHVKVFRGAGGGTMLPGPAANFFPYDPSFTGGVRVAVGDVNGDTVGDIITAPGPGGGPHVRIFNGATGTEIFGFFPYDPGFTGGVFVASGDVNGDGRADIITAPGAGGGPNVRVFSGATGGVLSSFLAYDPAFTGGVTVAAGDINGDGRADIVTGPGAGGGPLVRVFDGPSSALINSFFAYDPSFTGGVFVAGGIGF